MSPLREHAVLDATVMHRRLRPRENSFRYPVSYLALDLDRIDAAAGRWLAVDQPGLVAFHRRDHGARDGSDLRPWLARLLAEHGLAACCDGSATLMTMPRMLGYVFNPVSFWLCRDRAGGLRAVLCEVRNTFGEAHCYLVSHDDGRCIEPAAWLQGRKVFHVSPFLPVEGHYRFRFRAEAEHIRIDIHYHDAQGLILATSVGGRCLPLSDGTVLRRFLARPTMTLGVVARIHWQALHIWRKRATFYRKPSPPHEIVTR